MPDLVYLLVSVSVCIPTTSDFGYEVEHQPHVDRTCWRPSCVSQTLSTLNLRHYGCAPPLDKPPGSSSWYYNHNLYDAVIAFDHSAIARRPASLIVQGEYSGAGSPGTADGSRV